MFNSKYYRELIKLQCKKFLFAISDYFAIISARSLIFYMRFFPQWIQRYFLIDFLILATRAGTQYLYWRALFTYRSKLLILAVELAEAVTKYWYIVWLDCSELDAKPAYIALVKDQKIIATSKIYHSYLFKLFNPQKTQQFRFFLSMIDPAVQYYCIDAKQENCYRICFKENSDNSLEEIQNISTQQKYFVIKDKSVNAVMQSFAFKNFNFRYNDFRLLAICMFNGNLDYSLQLLRYIPSVSGIVNLHLAQRYFELGQFTACKIFLEQYLQQREHKFSVAKILAVETPNMEILRCAQNDGGIENNKKYQIFNVAPAREYHFTSPAVFPQRLQNLPQHTLMLPPEQIYHVHNAEVYFGDVVVSESEFLLNYDAAARPCFDFVAGHWSYLYGSSLQMNYGMLYGSYESEQEITAGILLDGRASFNYFHWIIEYLARAYTLQKMPAIAQLPIIVNKNLLPASKQALQLCFPKREIIWIDKKTKLKIKDLYIPSLHTIHPDHMQMPLWKIAGLSTEHLACVRDIAYQHANIVKQPARKIYLKRLSNMRQMLNVSEIDALMQRLGFESIDPATLSFIEQVELFAAASCIVGVGGAAFTNLMFCQPGCKVIGLISEQLEDFCMQSNIAAFAGCEFMYVSGSAKKSLKGHLSRVNHTHEAFVINPNKLKKALQHYGII